MGLARARVRIRVRVRERFSFWVGMRTMVGIRARCGVRVWYEYGCGC